jgi:hypothetical protein
MDFVVLYIEKDDGPVEQLVSISKSINHVGWNASAINIMSAPANVSCRLKREVLSQYLTFAKLASRPKFSTKSIPIVLKDRFQEEKVVVEIEKVKHSVCSTLRGEDQSDASNKHQLMAAVGPFLIMNDHDRHWFVRSTLYLNRISNHTRASSKI